MAGRLRNYCGSIPIYGLAIAAFLPSGGPAGQVTQQVVLVFANALRIRNMPEQTINFDGDLLVNCL